MMTLYLSDSDDEFVTAIHGVPYPQPLVYQYPDAHPDLEIFLHSESQVEHAAFFLPMFILLTSSQSLLQPQ